MQDFQGLRRTPLGPRVFTCAAIYHSNSTPRPFFVLRKSLFLFACTTLSKTSGDYAGPPGLHLCCNLPLELHIPPFPRNGVILVFVGLCNAFKDFGGQRRARGFSLVLELSTRAPHSALPAWFLFLLACTALSRTSADNAGPPGLHLCCNLPIELNIPPFPRNGTILVSVGLHNTFKDFGAPRRAPGSPLVL